MTERWLRAIFSKAIATGQLQLYFDDKRTSFLPVDKSGFGQLADAF